MTYPSSDDQPSNYESSAPAYQSQPGAAAATGEDPGQTFGILAIVFAFVFSPVGIVLGYLSRKKSRESGRADNSLGKIGFILSIVFLVLSVLSWILVIILSVVAAGAGAGASY